MGNWSGNTQRALLAEAVALLREVEWGDDHDFCPVCGGADPKRFTEPYPMIGHAPDCRLAALLAKAGEEAPGG